MGNGDFLLVERDNQYGPYSSVKRVYRIDLSNASFTPDPPHALIDARSKQLEIDLKTAYEDENVGIAGLMLNKIEGLAFDSSRNTVFVVNDNDAAHDNSGETQLRRFVLIGDTG